MNKIFPHIHTKKVLLVLNYCSKRYNHAVERNLPLTENLLPRVWLFSTAYSGVSQSSGSTAQRKRTTDRWCKLWQRPPFVSVSSLTPIRGPPVTALDFRAPWSSPWDTHHSCKLTSDNALLPARSPPHSSLEAPSGLTQAPGPSHSFCCFRLPVLGSGTISISHGRSPCWKDYANGCSFISSCVHRNGPLPFLHFAPWLCSVVVRFTTSRTPHGFREAAVFTRQWVLLSTDHTEPAEEANA